MVSISPTSSVRMAKLSPIIDSSPTGANSVVLKMKAARARAMTAGQLVGVAVSAVPALSGALVLSGTPVSVLLMPAVSSWGAEGVAGNAAGMLLMGCRSTGGRQPEGGCHSVKYVRSRARCIVP